MIFGIATNVFPQQAAVLEYYRRAGLFVMLAGMVLILFCFPTARRWLTSPLAVLQYATGVSGAARMIALHCGLVFGALLVAAFFDMTYQAIPAVVIQVVFLAIVLVWLTTAPRVSRPFFLAAVVPSALHVTADSVSYFMNLSMQGAFGWASPPIDDFLWLFLTLGGSIPLGFIGLGAAWVARKVGGEEA